MKIAFASDFDNTLYFQKNFHEEDLKAIEEFQKKGNRFGVCTGRSLNGVLIPSLNKINYDFYIIATGALILDKDFRSIYESPLEEKDIEGLYESYSKDYGIAFLTRSDFVTISAQYDPCIIVDDINDIPRPIFGLSFFAKSEENARKLKKEIILAFPNVDVHQNGMFLDINHKGNSKGTAVKIIKEKMGYDLIACMGDNYNDVSMLSSADISFTFPSSPQIIKEKATHIKSSISEALKDL